IHTKQVACIMRLIEACRQFSTAKTYGAIRYILCGVSGHAPRQLPCIQYHHSRPGVCTRRLQCCDRDEQQAEWDTTQREGYPRSACPFFRPAIFSSHTELPRVESAHSILIDPNLRRLAPCGKSSIQTPALYCSPFSPLAFGSLTCSLSF